VGKVTVLGGVVLLSALLCRPAGAQFADQEWLAAPAPKGVKSAKPATPHKPPPLPTRAARPAGTTAPAQETKTETLDPKNLNPKNPNDWGEVGLLEAKGGNFAGAEASFERTFALGANGDGATRLAVAKAMHRLSMVYRTKYSFALMEAKNVARFAGKPDELTTLARGYFDKAKTFLEQALALNKALGNKEGMAANYAGLADFYGEAPDEAKAMLEQALTLNKALQRKKEIAANYAALAQLHRSGNDFDGAEAMLKEAVALNEALVLKPEMAANYESLGDICLQRGAPDEAEQLYKQALAIAEAGDKRSPLNALERLYRNLGDPGRSEQMRAEARGLDAERGGGRLLFSFDLGLWQSAAISKEQLEALQNAVPLEKALRHELGLATSYTLLALHYSDRANKGQDKGGELAPKAEAMLKDALALASKLGREKHMAFIYRQLVEVVDRRGDLGEVEATLTQAAQLHKKLGEEDDMAQLYSSLAYARKERGDKAQACAYLRQGALAYPENRRLVDSLNLDKCAATQ
jgi:tetratricopeptide (TPR) repeat protein